MNPIPYGRQHITSDDIEAVINTLTSDYLTQGPQIQEFEKAFATYIGVKHAVAVSNGTAALHLAALAFDINESSHVLTTPITFAASANCIRYCGGTIAFVDIDPLSILIDLNRVEHILRSSSKKYLGVIPVDFAGNVVNLEDLRELADKYGLWIIEDACHSPGGYFINSSHKKVYCGSGDYADLSVFSFHPVKHIATGEGGMITTNNDSLYQKLLKLRTHGITRQADLFDNSVKFAAADSKATQYPNWYMEMQDLGYNYRLTDFQAALGISQLKRASEGLVKRREIAKTYFAAFEKEEQISWQSGVVEGHAYHLYVIQVVDRLGLYNYLRTKNIFTQIHYIPCHLMPYYRQFGWKEGDMPHAEKYYSQCLSLPMYPTLTKEEQQYVIQEILSYLNKK